MSGDIPISIDDPEKDEVIIRDRLVDEGTAGVLYLTANTIVKNQ